MTNHYMNLFESPFNLIKDEIKTIELRLNDEKRRLIKVNDFIIFENINNKSKKIKTKVINIYHFKSFEDLYLNLDLLKCGYTEKDIKEASYIDMLEYYSQDKEYKYGVLGIELKLVK